ncbi:polymer-forming cytoskeletal protein [Prolixibacteraceae bacterium JC049]|nr:polymer-forming cytoskeletal protein [Prolixibacteraceae bacterium JC049]
MGRSQNDNDKNAINLLGAGTVITGDIQAEGDIRIDGTLKGNLTAKGRVVIGNTGSVNGEVKCQTSEIAGTIEGKITVENLLSLKSSSKLKGDIITGKLSIEPGAAFSGSCQMNGQQ